MFVFCSMVRPLASGVPRADMYGQLPEYATRCGYGGLSRVNALSP